MSTRPSSKSDRSRSNRFGDLKSACDRKLADYVARRGDAIWDHRRRSARYISGTLRYDVLKSAKFHCELCGVSADERAPEVDHVTPRNKGGADEIGNLQAPLLQVQCYETGP
jgi:ATP adenylyltransferase